MAVPAFACTCLDLIADKGANDPDRHQAGIMCCMARLDTYVCPYVRACMHACVRACGRAGAPVATVKAEGTNMI